MSTNKHLGPWGRHNSIIAELDENGIRMKRIATVNPTLEPDEKKAIACLIAAAPEELVMLGRLFHRHGDLSDQGACIIGLICVAAALIVIAIGA